MKLSVVFVLALAVSQAYSGDFGDTMFKALGTYISSISQLVIDIDSIHAKDSKENIVLSPLNLGSALSVLLAASKGETREELKRLLKLDIYNLPDDYYGVRIHSLLGHIHSLFAKQRVGDKMKITQAIGAFVQNGLELNQDSKKLIEEQYRLKIESFDFIKHAEEAKDVINQWANDATNGKISSMLADIPDPSTEIIIATALYFNALWKYPFTDGVTQRSKFQVGKDEKVEVDMMNIIQDLPFHADESLGVKIVGLPYEANKISNLTMYVLLPESDDENALNELKSKLNVQVLRDLVKKMSVQNCIIGLPKMSISSNIDLKDSLTKLGAKSLFENPDLSTLAPSSSGLNLDMYQKIEMSIDEKGTEGASSTVAMFGPRFLGISELIANRPFLFFIQDQNSQLIFFWASINRPVPNY